MFATAVSSLDSSFLAEVALDWDGVKGNRWPRILMGLQRCYGLSHPQVEFKWIQSLDPSYCHPIELRHIFVRSEREIQVSSFLINFKKGCRVVSNVGGYHS